MLPSRDRHDRPDEQIACEFAWVPGYLYGADDRPSSDETAALNREAALAMALGFDAEFLTDVPFVHRPGIRFDHQAKFHPRKYLAGLAHAIIARGGQLFEHSAVEEFSDDPVKAKANGCTITAGYVILATHTPLRGNTPAAYADLFQTKLALYRYLHGCWCAASTTFAGRVASTENITSV